MTAFLSVPEAARTYAAVRKRDAAAYGDSAPGYVIRAAARPGRVPDALRVHVDRHSLDGRPGAHRLGVRPRLYPHAPALQRKPYEWAGPVTAIPGARSSAARSSSINGPWIERVEAVIRSAQ
ncbi:hypothetical protein C8N24_0263 [Solirubrobacter pauli]|uniref:Uncharacterized protein n=1 Tax=Solirubrobacter pauli TaxID=166793 RepID=A0A660L950_9ACTN|nr:hypothetical protein C8N24_0263 [Solirubrobacter pauli]